MTWTRRTFYQRGAASVAALGLFVSSLLASAIPLLLPVNPLSAQEAIPAGELDPARDPSRLTLPARTTSPPEQYIWTQEVEPAGTKPVTDTQWLFRRVFSLAAVPRTATLYVAASGDVEVWLNGVRLLAYKDDRTLPPGYTVHVLNAVPMLRSGENAVLICVRNLHGAHHTTTDRQILQFVGGRAIAVKLLPAQRGVEALPILKSDATWQAESQVPISASRGEDALKQESGPRFSANWHAATPLGAVEGNINFFQWNADAGMYAWPGYVGASSFLRHYTLRATQVLNDFIGSATVEHEDQLTRAPSRNAGVLSVKLSPQSATEQSPALTLDFGREVVGRIHLQSASDTPILLSAAYGESDDEALHQPFLGVRTIYVPPHGDAWGPKSAFRFVRVHFLSNARLTAIDLDGIAYPVEYKGSFTSSDPQMNRIWETGAYTAHLCMQDGMWDGVKRDRARWAGDIDVSGRVVNDVFADRALLEDTYERLISEAGSTRHVNGITGYSALWISSVAEFYRHNGDRDFLLRTHTALLDLLKTMDRDIGADGLFTPQSGEHVFVDWSPGLSEDTPEARRATDFEFLLAYKDAAWLLAEMGDASAGAHYAARYDQLRQQARALLMDPTTHTFGATWQTNAMAVLSGAASAVDYPILWNRVFANIDIVTADSAVITPYYGYYVLEAMAMLGHRAEALAWMRDYWGGMIAEGATSFWESYDPRWTKHHFHTALQADGLAGYYVSLAHGWSAGPTAWLMDELLGIRPTSAGFRTAIIEPELAGLQWIDGAVPTPDGNIRVHAASHEIRIDLPPDVKASVLLNISGKPHIRLNDAPVQLHPAQMPGYRQIEISGPGHYELALN